MLRGLALAGAFALAVPSHCASAQNPPSSRPPVEAFGNLPFLSSPKLSPDGKYIAVLQPFQGKNAAVIFKARPGPGDKPAMVPTSGDVLLVDVLWAKNDRLVLITIQNKQIAFADQPRIQTWVRAIAVDPDGKNGVALLRNMPMVGVNGSAASIVDINLDDPDNILMALYSFEAKSDSQLKTHLAMNSEDFFRFDLIRVDVRTGKGTLDTAGSSRTTGWIADGHGKPIARIDESKRPLQEHLYALNDGSWKEIGTFDASGDRGAGVAGPSEDGKALVHFAQSPDGYWSLYRRELSTGSVSALFQAPGYDVRLAITDEWTGEAIGAKYVDDRPRQKFFDAGRQGLQAGLEKAFPDLNVSIVSWSRDKNVVLFAVDGPRSPMTYYLLDRTTHETSTLASTYPHLGEADLGAMKPYNYVARDGLAIPAYLTLPPGKEAKKLPVVVMPHGGPDARDQLAFDWWAQFLANRGYAVLQPNYRGSAGYGRAFTDAGLQQWGLKMQDDISDGVKKLITDGIADPKRVCIVGGSYGGYAALAGAAFTPELYACAASYAGVSDLPQEIHETFRDFGNQSQVYSFWGSRIGMDDLAKLSATSPARRAQDVKCPILLMHGEGDTTVRITQSELMAEALQKAGKKVEFIRFAGEDHYMNNAATRIRMLTELERFLRENIGD